MQWLGAISVPVLLGVLALALISGAAFWIWSDEATKAPTFSLDFVGLIIAACAVVVLFMFQVFFTEPPKVDKKPDAKSGALGDLAGRSRPHLYIIFVPLGWWTIVFLSWLMKDTVLIADILWGVLWEENPKLTIATPLVLDFVIFLIRKGKKNESPETKTTGVVILAVLIVFWASAFGQKIWKGAEETVSSVWTDETSTSITTSNQKGSDTTQTASKLSPIILTAKRDEYTPAHTVWSGNLYKFDINYNGKIMIMPNGDPTRAFPMEVGEKKQGVAPGYVIRTLQFMSLESDRDVEVTIQYIPKK